MMSIQPSYMESQTQTTEPKNREHSVWKRRRVLCCHQHFLTLGKDAVLKHQKATLFKQFDGGGSGGGRKSPDSTMS